MGSQRHVKALAPACDGEHLLIWGLGGQPGVDIALAELLAGWELRGSRVPVVTLLLRGREDADWIGQAVPWLALRGRRVIVRTRQVMPRALVSILAEVHRGRAGVGFGAIVVELELAHPKPAIQRALLGAQADTVAALLLQAQHLETLGLPVVARLAPLLPGIHDQPNGFTPLLRNLIAADLRHVTLEVGRLHPAQLRALVAAQRELAVAGLLELARAYGVDPLIALGGAPVPRDLPVLELKRRRAQVFAHGLEQVAREHPGGLLRLPACARSGACSAHCELAASEGAGNHVRRYEPVLGMDLFAPLA